ncbi:MAG: hypothetical protein KF819_31710 [Labilithrix sp.]|nr:hypothetical protein [Labilithrix sp.]
MIRRSAGLSAFVALAAVMSMGVAQGCGGDEVTPGDDAASPDGPVETADASPSEGDGSTLPDGAPKPDGSGDVDAETDAAVDAPDEDAGEQGPLSPEYVDYDVNHVLITGQSNSVANGGSPPIAAAQPYTNVMFNTGVMPMTNCNGNGCFAYQTPASFAPLVEGDNFFNYTVETPASGLANEISYLALQQFEFGARAGYPAKHDVLVSNHGRSGNTYWCLRKVQCPYRANEGYLSPFGQGMMEVQSAKTLADPKTHVVRAVVAIHGESDHYSYVANNTEFAAQGLADYKAALLEWQADYESSIQAITGQAQPVPLLISGLSGWVTTRTSLVAQMQLDAHIAAPGKVVYATPAYPLSVRSDCLHYDQNGYRRLGEYFAKVYSRIVFAGATWEPVRPMQITRAGNVVTVKFHVPKPPLVFDVAQVTNPGNFGFDFVDDGAIVASTAAVTGPDTVTITLAAAPSGVNMRLRYAQNQNTTPATRCIGPGTVYGGGARGNLRDSDTTPSRYGYPLHNWGVNFDIAVP